MARSILTLTYPAPFIAADADHVVAPFVFFSFSFTLWSLRNLMLFGPFKEPLIHALFALPPMPVLLAEESESVAVGALNLGILVRSPDPAVAAWVGSPLFVLVSVDFVIDQVPLVLLYHLSVL